MSKINLVLSLFILVSLVSCSESKKKKKKDADDDAEDDTTTAITIENTWSGCAALPEKELNSANRMIRLNDGSFCAVRSSQIDFAFESDESFYGTFTRDCSLDCSTVGAEISSVTGTYAVGADSEVVEGEQLLD